MIRPSSFVVLTGLPASGKSTLGRRLAEALEWPFLDKDDFLEALFDERGCDGPEARQRLSREADARFRERAEDLPCAVLCSFWREPGGTGASGTPCEWVGEGERRCFEVFCRVDSELAISRYTSRARHPGHHDSLRSPEALRAQFATLSAALPFGAQLSERTLEVDTNSQADVGAIARSVQQWAAG